MKTQRIAAAGLCAALMFSPTIARADVVLDWNEIMVTVVADQPPTQMNRIAAITHLAVFEAVNAVTGDHKPYLGTVTSVARRLRRRGGHCGGPWGSPTLPSRSRGIPRCGTHTLPRQDSRRSRQGGRHHDRRDSGSPHDRRA